MTDVNKYPPNLLGYAVMTAGSLHAHTNRWCETILSALRREGKEPSCTGCSVAGCCRQPVMITFLEGLPIAMRLDSLGLNAEDLRRRYKEIGLEVETRMAEGRQSDEVSDCVFLDNNRCSIYDIRPAICRSYFAMSPREDCNPYCERADGLRPKICTIDYSPIMGASLQAAIEVADRIGLLPVERAWPRPLPLIVSEVMQALTLPSDMFWGHINRTCHMDLATFYRITDHQGRDPVERAIL